MNVAIILKEIIGRGICKSRNKLNLIYKLVNLFLADVIQLILLNPPARIQHKLRYTFRLNCNFLFQLIIEEFLEELFGTGFLRL